MLCKCNTYNWYHTHFSKMLSASKQTIVFLHILIEKHQSHLDMHRVINCLHCMQNWGEIKINNVLTITVALVCVVVIVSCILLVSICFSVQITFARWMTQRSKSKANEAHFIIRARAVTKSMHTKQNVQTLRINVCAQKMNKNKPTNN